MYEGERYGKYQEDSKAVEREKDYDAKENIVPASVKHKRNLQRFKYLQTYVRIRDDFIRFTRMSFAKFCLAQILFAGGNYGT